MATVKVDWSTWKPRLGYGAFFALACLRALRQTLPADAMRDRLVQEAAQRGWKLSAEGAGPAGLVGVRLTEVSLKDKDGMAVPMEALEVTLRPLPLLLGKARLGVVARLWDGSVRATVDASGAPQALEVSLEHLDLSQAVPLRKAAGVDLAGLATGSGRFTLPADERGRPQGQADLTVAGAGLAGGKLPIPGMGGELTIPRVSLGQLTTRVVLAEGKATVERLATAGGDLTLNADGVTVVLQPRLEYAPLSGKLSLKVEEPFAARPENRPFKSLLDAALAAGKGRDGAYHLALAGTLGHPQARAMPTP